MNNTPGAGHTEKTDLSKLTDFQIFAIILAHLHIKYDHGGYSFGRSIQSDAIEFRNLIPHCGFSWDYAGNLGTETKKRIEAAKKSPRRAKQLVLDLGPVALTTQELIQLSLKNLVWWYKRHAKSNGFLDTESPRLVGCLYELHVGIYGNLTCNRRSSLPVLMALITEIKRRASFVLEEEGKYQDYALLIGHMA